MTIFPQTPRSDSQYLIETTAQVIGRSLSRYSCLLLRSLFPTNDNNSSEHSNLLNETLYLQTAIQCIFFCLKITSSTRFQLSIKINKNRKHLFSQKSIIFGCRQGLFVCFCELCISFVLNLLQNTGCSKMVDPILNTHISETTTWIILKLHTFYVEGHKF